MGVVLILGSLGAAMAGIAVLLFISLSAGQRAGDRVGDAQSRVEVVPPDWGEPWPSDQTAVVHGRPGPDGPPAVAALVTVANPAPAPVVVGVAARPLRFRWGRDPVAVRVPKVPRLDPSGQLLVGVVDGASESQWLVPLGPCPRPVCRVVIALGQPDGRLRLVGHLVDLRPAMVSRARSAVLTA